MNKISSKIGIIKAELKEVFKLKTSSRPWSVPILAALCVGIPLFMGLFIGDFSSVMNISLAGLVILYMPIQSSISKRLLKVLLCSFGFMISYAIGIAFSFNPLVSCVVFGLFSACIHWISLTYRIGPPGNFFFIMLASMASGLPFDVTKIPERIGLVAIGTMLACFFALLYSLLSRDVKQTATNEVIIRTRIVKDRQSVESMIIGLFMFASLLVGHLFGFDRPYWLPISCLAVMQGATAFQIWRRGFYRILGTFLGMALCWLILMLIDSPLWLCIAVVILQFIIEAIVTRNYTIAVIFITPMTILLIEATSTIAQNPTELIGTRMIDVLVGSLIGAVGGWFIHHEKMKQKFFKQLRLTRIALKRTHAAK